ncbi:hypothetical protein N7468_001398 [Penicillium chermesinum]|uniref:Uncharacterized protein n=1 Tax=Penicillium chermesinum TaxID=63820 RepID=A0A9W9TWR2_9EURO|nr:uncharacterized protein N7468_001398 [Penicillium chermesinum]KAJ5246415.1 hypothetical protein N7468_001398 [Penicillium chermesinum]
MFGIQFDAAGIYLVGTPTAQFHLAFEELISFPEGIAALLEYGVTCKVLSAVIGRMRHRVGQQAATPPEAHPPLWIDSSGPTLYEVCHGERSILVSIQELESSRLGRMIKSHWDGSRGSRYLSRMILEALIIGMWGNFLRCVKFRRSRTRI